MRFLLGLLLLVLAGAVRVQAVGLNTASPTPSPTGEDYASVWIARLNADACAEELDYGPQSVADGVAASSDGAYLSTLWGEAEHALWVQYLDTTDADAPEMRIDWYFDEEKTLAERFENAVCCGEGVAWSIFLGAEQAVNGTVPDVVRTGTWYFSNNAGVTESTFDGRSGSGFSNDDGCWGAPLVDGGTVDGNLGGNVGYGLSNYNAGDSYCSRFYEAGVYTAYSGLVSDILMVAAASELSSASPTMAPSVSPTTSFAPTQYPTFAPSLAPTVRQTLAFPLRFARLSADACAEDLAYGPSTVSEGVSSNSDGAYLSTLRGEVEHTGWVQYLDTTDTGAPEMRIEWAFSDFKTLAERFENAVCCGESVTWSIYIGAGQAQNGTVPDVVRTGTWYFSNNAGVTESTFDGRSGSGFSNDDGCWGAPLVDGDTVDGDFGGNVGYGICNYNAGDSYCSHYYVGGSYTSYSGLTVDMYMRYNASAVVTTSPTMAPSVSPTMSFAPTQYPTFAPSLAPTVRQTLAFPLRFARLSADACAEDLAYGPSTVSEGVSSNSDGAYLSTLRGEVEHTGWVQYLDTTDTGAPEMRIEWAFSDFKTLAERFENAVCCGESVTWSIYIGAGQAQNGTVPDVVRTGTWYFSNNAGVTESTFDGRSGSGFSNDDGCWGAPLVDGDTVDGDFGGNVGYGICNYNAGDSYCSHYYVGGSYTSYSGLTVDMYMRYNASEIVTSSPSLVPSMAPSHSTLEPTFYPTFSPTAFPTVQATGRYPAWFARLGADACAEDLPYGPSSVSDGLLSTGSNGFLSTLRVDELHTVWVQYIQSSTNADVEMRIEWVFRDEKTLAERFDNAVCCGEPVTWSVFLGTNALNGTTPDVIVRGMFEFSHSSAVTEATFDGSNSSFSADDGCWGAPLSDGGTVDGGTNGEEIGYGLCNHNSADTDCGNLWVAGSATYHRDLVSDVFFTLNESEYHTLAPSVSPTGIQPSTSSPSSHPTVYPTPEPTLMPTEQVTTMPTALGTTLSPTLLPTVVSTSPMPTVAPSSMPTVVGTTPSPTLLPTVVSTSPIPTIAPSSMPTIVGTTPSPTLQPTVAVTSPTHTDAPGSMPTKVPTCRPTPIPTDQPTMAPTAVPTPAPTMAPTEIQYPILAWPIVGVAGIDEATVEVSADRSGTAYCALFASVPANGFSSSVIEPSAESVTLVGASAATIPFVSLEPLTTYYGGCFARDTSQLFSTPGRFIEAYYTFNITTGCCRGLTLAQPSTWVYEQDTSDIFTITLGSAPSDEVMLRVRVYDHSAATDGACNGTAAEILNNVNVTAEWQESTRLVARPSSFTIGGGANVLESDFVLVASAVNESSCHAVVVSTHGASAAEYDAVDNAIMSVLSLAVEPIPPIMSTAEFDTTGSLIAVTFDSDTDRAELTGQFGCSLLFSFISSGDASCQWSSDAQVIITLSAASSSLPVVGDSVTLLANVLKAACTAEDTAQCDNWDYTASHSVAIDEPSTPVVPVPVIDGPTDIASCDAAVWNAYLSQNSGGRAWSAINFTIGILGTSAPNFTSHTDTIAVSPGDLAARSYAIGLTLTNFFGRSASTTSFVSVSALPKPTVTIIGGSTQSFHAFDDVYVEADGVAPDVSSCSVNASSLSFSWEALWDSAVTSESVNPRVFKLSAGRLSPGNSYQAEVTVSMDTNSSLGVISNTALVTIIVEQSALVAKITNRPARHPIFQNLRLKGGESYDPDYPQLGTLGLTFEWQCMELWPTFGDDCVNTSAGGVTMDDETLVVPSGLLVADSIWRFTLIVGDEDDLTRATATDDITITIGSVRCPRTEVRTVRPIHNVGSDVLVTGKIGAVYSSTSYLMYNWTVTDGEFLGSLSLDDVALTATTGTRYHRHSVVMLKLDGAYTLPGTTYVLRLEVAAFDRHGNAMDSDCYTEVNVVMNRPPTPGYMTISPPDNATIGDTVITLQAHSFSDIHTPFRYRWTADDGRRVKVLSPFSRSSSLSFVWWSTPFPEPVGDNSTEVTIYLTVADSRGATTVVSERYDLYASNIGLRSLGNTVEEKRREALASKDPNKVNEVLVAGSKLTDENCMSSCESQVHREPCSPTVGFCGDCLSGYSGPSGPSNGRCSRSTSSSSSSRRRGTRRTLHDATAVSALPDLRVQRELAVECPNPTGVNGDCGGSGINCTRCDLNDTCDVDSDCDSGYCDAGRCAIPLRSCPNNCTDNGTCTAYDMVTFQALPSTSTCLVTNTECRVFCVCEEGLFGEQCSLSNESFAEQKAFVHNLVLAAETSESLTDSSASEVDIILGALEDSTSKPHLLLWSDLVDILNMVVSVLQYYVENEAYTSDLATSAATITSNVLTRVLLERLQGNMSAVDIAEYDALMNASHAASSVALSAMAETSALGETFGDIENDLVLGTFGVLAPGGDTDQWFQLPATNDEEWYDLPNGNKSAQVTFLASHLAMCDGNNTDGFFVFASQRFFDPRAAVAVTSTNETAQLGHTLQFGRTETGVNVQGDTDDAATSIADGIADVQLLVYHRTEASTTIVRDSVVRTVECQAGLASTHVVTCPYSQNETRIHCSGTAQAYSVEVECGNVSLTPDCQVWLQDAYDAQMTLCWPVAVSADYTHCECDLFSATCEPVLPAFSLYANTTGMPSEFEISPAYATDAVASSQPTTIVGDDDDSSAADDDGDDDGANDDGGGGGGDNSLVLLLGVVGAALIVVGIIWQRYRAFVKAREAKRERSIFADDSQANLGEGSRVSPAASPSHVGLHGAVPTQNPPTYAHVRQLLTLTGPGASAPAPATVPRPSAPQMLSAVALTAPLQTAADAKKLEELSAPAATAKPETTGQFKPESSGESKGESKADSDRQAAPQLLTIRPQKREATI